MDAVFIKSLGARIQPITHEFLRCYSKNVVRQVLPCMYHTDENHTEVYQDYKQDVLEFPSGFGPTCLVLMRLCVVQYCQATKSLL